MRSILFCILIAACGGSNEAMDELARVFPAPVFRARATSGGGGGCFTERGRELSTFCDAYQVVCEGIGQADAWDPSDRLNRRVVQGAEFMDLCAECRVECEVRRIRNTRPAWPETIPWPEVPGGDTRNWTAHCPFDKEPLACWMQ